MKQNKKQSLIESLANTFLGFVVSYISTFFIFPVVGYDSTPGGNLIITLYFTFVSIGRGYVVRRYFNKKHSISI